MQGVRRIGLDSLRKVKLVSGEGDRTIVRLWRDAVSAGRTGTAYLTETEPATWREVSWNRGRADAWTSSPTGSLARESRRATPSGSSAGHGSSGRCSTSHWRWSAGSRPPSTPNSSASEPRIVLRHSEAVGAFVEDDEQAAKVVPLGCSTPDNPRPRRAAADGIAFAREHPAGSTRRRGRRRGRPLHLHLHLRHDRPARRAA
jgi:hypothetical protein